MPRTPIGSIPDWSSALAYAVGLITTDGSLSKDGRHIILTSTDLELIATFLRCLQKELAIKSVPISKIGKKKTYKVQISDVILYRWLKSIGLFPNKTLTLNQIDVPSKFLPDFLRGHLDGDGSIINYKDRYNTKINRKYVYDRLFIHFLLASKNHILWLRKQIRHEIQISGSIQEHKSKTQHGENYCWRLKYSTKEAKVILNWLYYKADLPCLERKLLVARPYLNT